jgi:predicted nuclease of predicted toxin-antitoxin system
VAERIAFYLDEHVPRAVTGGLRRRGVDALTAQEAGLQGANDEEHLAFALREGRVTFTQDADFLRLHAAGRSHPGIVYVPQQAPIGAIVRGLMLIYEVLSPEDMTGHVEFL